MDALAHIFIPLTAAYVLRGEQFPSSKWLLLGLFGLLADFDKFLGIPGLLHSLMTLVPICMVLLLGERLVRNEVVLSPILVGFVMSHLVLDLVDGGPVPLLYPLIKTGIGFQYPVQAVFGAGLVGIAFEGPLLALRVGAPLPGHNTYGFLTGTGIASVLVFLTIYAGDGERGTRNS